MYVSEMKSNSSHRQCLLILIYTSLCRHNLQKDKLMFIFCLRIQTRIIPEIKKDPANRILESRPAGLHIIQTRP